MMVPSSTRRKQLYYALIQRRRWDGRSALAHAGRLRTIARDELTKRAAAQKPWASTLSKTLSPSPQKAADSDRPDLSGDHGRLVPPENVPLSAPMMCWQRRLSALMLL